MTKYEQLLQLITDQFEQDANGWFYEDDAGDVIVLGEDLSTLLDKAIVALYDESDEEESE